MKIVVVAAMYPPAGHGGAEDCARSFSQWAACNGHDVTVVMAAADQEDTSFFQDGRVTVHRIQTDHIFPVAQQRSQPGWKKPIWYLQDHLGRTTPLKIAELVQNERPDIIVVHYLQGFGYRTISELARLRTPIAIVLHDLGLICCRMGMFRNNKECSRPCLECRLSTAFKSNIFTSALRETQVGFISPSQANIEKIRQFFPVDAFPSKAILNTKTYPVSHGSSDHASRLALLYAGKLESSKGIDRLVEAVSTLPADCNITLEIAGDGSLCEMLRRRCAGDKRISFLGFISQEHLAEAMSRASVLCVPSVWPENSPGVVIQAILNGLPVVATSHGGLPELVRDDIDGKILADDSVTGWAAALQSLCIQPNLVALWRQALREVQPRFNIDAIGEETLHFLNCLRRYSTDAVSIS